MATLRVLPWLSLSLPKGQSLAVHGTKSTQFGSSGQDATVGITASFIQDWHYVIERSTVHGQAQGAVLLEKMEAQYSFLSGKVHIRDRSGLLCLSVLRAIHKEN